jgi:hypothetical protein
MNGVPHNVAVLKDRSADNDRDAVALDLQDFEMVEEPNFEYGEGNPRTDWRGRIVDGLFAIVTFAWIGAFAFVYGRSWVSDVPELPVLVMQIAMLFAPLAFLTTFYALVTRSSRSQARLMTDASALMRTEQSRLEATLQHVAARVAAEKADLADTNDRLMSLGEEAAHRLKSASDAMREEIDTLSRYGHALKFSATSARADVAVLLSDLPKAQLETRHMVAALQEAGVTAHERAGALDALLSSLTARGREADEIAGGAAQKLAAHLSRVESVSENAGARLEDAATRMTDAIDAALSRAAEAGETARANMDAQGVAMLALVDQTQAALHRTGSDSADAIATRVDDVTEKLEALGAMLASQAETTAQLLAGVQNGLSGIDTRFAALDDGGTARAERLGAALAKLDQHAATLTGSLEAGTGSADTLINRTEKLMTTLDASVREIDETLPAALSRLEAKSETTRAKVAETGPAVTAMERDASAALDRLIDAEALIVKQREALAAMADDVDMRLNTSRDSATQLISTVTDAEATTRLLAEGAGAQLVEALVRVRETAQSAAERAREAIAAVIPESAARLSDSAREALTKAITDQVQAQIAELATTAENAVETASKASDKLMRQMLTISETSAAVEARIAEARAEVEAGDRDNFSRRVALLIESLNSTAIDVTKLLSSDVTDSAWAAYLRGDRGIFTRRAVRLLDSGEAREVARHYDTDPEFRDQVNRYIHDFEAMLRNILSTRDGSALGVTLLSSDMGKLYVALAQAIERLRN